MPANETERPNRLYPELHQQYKEATESVPACYRMTVYGIPADELSREDLLVALWLTMKTGESRIANLQSTLKFSESCNKPLAVSEINALRRDGFLTINKARELLGFGPVPS